MIVAELAEGASIKLLNLDATVCKKDGTLMVTHAGTTTALEHLGLCNGDMLVEAEGVLLICLLHPVGLFVLVTGQLTITPDEDPPPSEDGTFEVKTETHTLLELK